MKLSGAAEFRKRRASGSRRAPGGLRSLLVLSFTILALSGCASGGGLPIRPPLNTLPYSSPLRTWTLGDADAWLRHHLMFGEANLALDLLDGGKSPVSDALLRSLQTALVLRTTGDYAGSNALLEWASDEVGRREVRSASRTAGSFLLNDRVLSYTPPPGEVGMIAFYRMMNHLDLADLEGAAVEARRLAALLDQSDRIDQVSCSGDGMLRYVAGLVFEAAGEMNDALVSLRKAESSFDSCVGSSTVRPPAGFGGDLYRLAKRTGVSEVADSALVRYPDAADRYVPGVGEVLVILERGFVAHLTEEALEVPIFLEDVDGVDNQDTDRITSIAASVVAQLTLGHRESGSWGSSGWDGRRGNSRSAGIEDVYFLRLAWPGVRRDPGVGENLRLIAGSDSLHLTLAADLSKIAAHELEAKRAGMLTRLVARGVAKYLLTREMEKKAEEEGGKFLGAVTGLLANAAANELERADTRSWTLLPDAISVARLTLPAGEHVPRIQIVSGWGEVTGSMDLGPIVVRPGGLTVVHRRLWSDDLSALALTGNGD